MSINRFNNGGWGGAYVLELSVPPGFIYLLDIIQLRTRSLRQLDKVIV